MDFSDTSIRFTSSGGVIDVASFVNNIAQGDTANFADNVFDLAIAIIFPRLLAASVVVAVSTVSFLDDVVGNAIDNTFRGVSDNNLRDRCEIKIPGSF